MLLIQGAGFTSVSVKVFVHCLFLVTHGLFILSYHCPCSFLSFFHHLWSHALAQRCRYVSIVGEAIGIGRVVLFLWGEATLAVLAVANSIQLLEFPLCCNGVGHEAQFCSLTLSQGRSVLLVSDALLQFVHSPFQIKKVLMEVGLLCL